MQQPFVSIVTVTYNAEKYLETTIKSVLAQNYPNINYILIDGKSTDSTVEIINKYKESIDYWISEPDKGIYDAMNKGTDAASGKWVVFMNAGDTFYNSNSIQDFINDVQADTELYSGAINFIQEDTNEVQYKPPYGLEKVWYSVPCWHQACFIKTSLMKEYPYSLEYKIASDHEFFIRCYVNKKKFQFTDKIIANMIAGGLHQQENNLAKIESLKILANYCDDAKALFESVFYKNLYKEEFIFDNFKFSKSFNLLYTEIEKIQKKYKNIALYGYGTVGKTIHKLIPENIKVIIDKSYETQESINNTPIANANNLMDHNFDVILISVLGREKEIIKMLENVNIPKSKILTFKINSND